MAEKQKEQKNTPVIEVENLVKRYGKTYALNGISFSVGEGETVGFLGPNGAGKSTTLNIITGYISSSGGSVKVGGYDILDSPEKAKGLIGYLPEIPPLYPDMTVGEYLEFVYELKGCSFPKRAHLEEIEKVTKIYEVRSRLISNLSKGYRQRVGIAQALVGDPKVIILDEPTVGLDPKQIIEIRNLIRRLGRNHTVILSTHILSEVRAVCDRIIIMENGSIAADEAADDIASAVNEKRRFNLKICGPSKEVLAALRGLEGVSYVEITGERELDAYTYVIECEKGLDIRKALFRLCAARDFPIIEFEAAGMSLEDVFIRLTDKKDADSKKARTGRDLSNI